MRNENDSHVLTFGGEGRSGRPPKPENRPQNRPPKRACLKPEVMGHRRAVRGGFASPFWRLPGGGLENRSFGGGRPDRPKSEARMVRSSPESEARMVRSSPESEARMVRSSKVEFSRPPPETLPNGLQNRGCPHAYDPLLRVFKVAGSEAVWRPFWRRFGGLDGRSKHEIEVVGWSIEA